MYPKHQEEPQYNAYQRLMKSVKQNFGQIPQEDVRRIRRLSPEQQESLLDVVALAETVDFFLQQVPEPSQNFPKQDFPFLPSNSVSNVFDKPPIIPSDTISLNEAIRLLKNWRTIASDREARHQLKALLMRFPENNHQADLWLKHLYKIEADRATQPPASETPATLNTEPVTLIQSEPNPNMESKPIIPGDPEKPNHRPLETTSKNADGTPETPSFQEKSILKFEIPTTQPITSEVRILQSRFANEEGKRKIVVELTVPEENWHFAVMVSKLVNHFVSFEHRIKDSLSDFFTEAEKMVCNSNKTQPEQLEGTQRLNEVTSNQAEMLIPAPKPRRQQRKADEPGLKKEKAKVGRKPKPGVPARNPETPSSSDVRTNPDKVQGSQQAQTQFTKSFIAITDLIRSEFGSIGKLFNDKDQKWISKGRLKGTAPLTGSMVRFLEIVTAQSDDFLNLAKPILVKLVESFQPLRTESKRNKDQWTRINDILRGIG
ncbi:MAG: hypothetical protein K1Y36_25660 [Blastocatellia bacterium]|nr:hypothetical protein [Blastocatellia bacterium]